MIQCRTDPLDTNWRTYRYGGASLLVQYHWRPDCHLIAELETWPSQRRKGHARLLLRYICDIADGEGVALTLSVCGDETNGGMTDEQLEVFYGSFGFAYGINFPGLWGGYMVRLPQDCYCGA